MSTLEEIYNDVQEILEDEKEQHMQNIQEFMADTVDQIISEIEERIRNYMASLE